MLKAEGVTSLMPLKWELSVQSWAALSDGSLEPRRSVDSTDSNRIGTDCKSSWKGTPTLPSDDACSGNKVQGAAFQRLRAKAP